MKKGDLVKWSLDWTVGRSDGEKYSHQIGVAIREWDFGWVVQWSDGNHRKVHRDYLEALCR